MTLFCSSFCIEFFHLEILSRPLCSFVCWKNLLCFCLWESWLYDKRSYNVQGLAFQEVFVVYSPFILLLCFGCSVPQVSHGQSFSLPAMGDVWALTRVWRVLNRCALVCLLKETCCYIHIAEAFQNSMVSSCGARGGERELCYSFGQRPTTLVLRPICLRKAAPAEDRGLGLAVSSLGLYCWHCTAYWN